MAAFMSFFRSGSKKEGYTEAFLGDDEEMYYNEELKKWVVKGKETQGIGDSKQVPPPPILTAHPSDPQSTSSNSQSTGRIGWNQKNSTHLYTNTPGINLKESTNKNESIYITPSHFTKPINMAGSNTSLDNDQCTPVSASSNFIQQSPFVFKRQPRNDNGDKHGHHDVSPVSNDEFNKFTSSNCDEEELVMCSDFPSQSNNTLGSGESQCQLLSNSSVLQSEIDTFEYKSPVVARDTAALSSSRRSTVHRQLTIQSRSTSIAHGSGVPICDVSNDDYEKFKKSHMHDVDNVEGEKADNDIKANLINLSYSPNNTLNNTLLLTNNAIDNTLTQIDKCVEILEKFTPANLDEVFNGVNCGAVCARITKQNDHLMQIMQNLATMLEEYQLNPPDEGTGGIDKRAILTIDNKLGELMGIMTNYQNKIFSICNMINVGGDFNSVKLDITHVESLLNKIEGVKNKLITDLKSQGVIIDNIDKEIDELEGRIESLKTSNV